MGRLTLPIDDPRWYNDEKAGENCLVLRNSPLKKSKSLSAWQLVAVADYVFLGRQLGSPLHCHDQLPEHCGAG